MAAFGIAASALGVFSLTLELMKIVKSAHRSVKLMQNALKNASELQIGLSTIENLLTEIGALCTDAKSDCGVSMCLERARSRLQVLSDIIQDIGATKLTHREKIKKAFRGISYDQKFSDASRLLGETIDCLSLGLLVLQLHETRQQSIDLSTINQTISWIAAQQTKQINSPSISNDIQKFTENLSRRLASLEATINQSSSSNVKIFAGDLLETSDPLIELHSGHRSEPTRSATSKDGKFTSKGVQTFPQEAQNQMDTADGLLGYRNRSTFLNASEIYSITHRDLNLLLGTLSIVYLRKRHRTMQKEKDSDSVQSWEVKIRFNPSWYFDTSLWARLWTNAPGGGSLQQSLTVMHTVPSSEMIWKLVSRMDIVGIREKFMKKEYSVNTVDEYGQSLLGVACKRGRSECVRFLLDVGAPSQGVDENGRNALLYGVDRYRPTTLGVENWAIYNLLVERCQLDPSEPDRKGCNFWHVFCENVPVEKGCSWQSISNHFRPIINEVDYSGRTSIFNLSSNPKGDIDLFRWHLNNKANISIPQADGLTCLHAAVASIQPRREISHITLEDLTGYSSSSWYHYDDKDRECQRKRVELLICHGANIFAISDKYGTPTDIAMLTGNFSLWIDALRNSGFDPKRVLAADKKIPRHRHLLSALQLARNEQRESKIRWKSLQDILVVLHSLEKSQKSISEQIIPEWECLSTSPLAVCMGTHQEIFLNLKGLVSNARIQKDDSDVKIWQFFLHAEILGGKYQSGFLDARTGLRIGPPLCREDYNNLDRYLDTLAKVASGDPMIDADTVDWKIYRRYVDIIKAAAILEWNYSSHRLLRRMRSMGGSESAEPMIKMPGSWPAEQ